MTLQSRLFAGGEEGFYGKLSDGKMKLLYRGKAAFPLFTCFLSGKLENKDGGVKIEYFLRRPIFTILLFSLWLFLLLVTGIVLLTEDLWISCACFLVFLLGLLPLCLFTEKEKKRFTEFLRSFETE